MPRATRKPEITTLLPRLASDAVDGRLQRFLGKLAGERFFGKVVLSFQNGQVCSVKLEQSKKLEDL